MSEIETKALKCVIGIAEKYPSLVANGTPTDALKLLQMAYLEGHMEGLKSGHEATMKVMHDTLSQR